MVSFVSNYQDQTQLLVAVDCIIFGFDNDEVKILLIKRNFEPEKGKWSLMGGFLQPDETATNAANR
ncbi:MAG TPA: DNA mismatch repair protein MutT, partial [Cytophagales bacterium]|nr:DNA mismatch repair protein MutT [Cytophagales bacterium]